MYPKEAATLAVIRAARGVVTRAQILAATGVKGRDLDRVLASLVRAGLVRYAGRSWEIEAT